jgi:hypothetical protein
MWREFLLLQQEAAVRRELLVATAAWALMGWLAIGLVAQAAVQAAALALRQGVAVKAAILAVVAVVALLHLERLTQAQVATVATGSCAW